MRRIMIVSDTHSHHENLKKAFETEGEIDLLIHLGDIEGEEDYVRALADCDVQMVAGNGDFFSELEREKTFMLGKYTVFITHGHYYYVSLGVDVIVEEAISRNADIVMFGHTHRPFVETIRGVLVINPGSISYPRQDDKKATYIMMEIDNQENVKCTIKSVN